jgi:hypothetical protein
MCFAVAHSRSRCVIGPGRQDGAHRRRSARQRLSGARSAMRADKVVLQHRPGSPAPIFGSSGRPLVDQRYVASPSRRLWAANRPGRRHSGYSSFRQLRGSAGCAFGVRSSRKLK